MLASTVHCRKHVQNVEKMYNMYICRGVMLASTVHCRKHVQNVKKCTICIHVEVFTMCIHVQPLKCHL